MRSVPTQHTQHQGFTLVETLVATTAGAMLVIGMAMATQLFVSEMSYVTDVDDRGPEEVLLAMSEGVRDAWWVDTPSADELRVVDAYGNTTRYVRNGSALEVVRPSGARGVLLTGVTDVTFNTDTVRRLRDLSPATVTGPWFTNAPPETAAVEISLTEGDALALGFHASSVAPASASLIGDVTEERLTATLSEIRLNLSFLDGSLMEFCHLHATPPHNPAHPGYEGRKLIVDLHEARAPDDGRPYGPSLATLEIPSTDLPPTSFYWWDPEAADQVFPPDAPGGGGPGQCHDYDGDGECDHPGNNPHHNPLDAPEGVAWGWWHQHSEAYPVFQPTTVPVSIDLSGLNYAIEAGRAYTLVFSVAGWDQVRIQSFTSTSTFNGVALDVGGLGYAPMMLAFPMEMTGTQTCTQTEAIDVVTSVTMAVDLDDGRSVSSSASVFGQTTVADEWLGVVPGQSEVLDL